MQANLYSHTGSSIKISGQSGVRFSVRFPVFVLLMVLSKKILCRKISFVILVHLHIKFFRWSGVRFSVRFPVFVLLMVVSMYFLRQQQIFKYLSPLLNWIGNQPNVMNQIISGWSGVRFSVRFPVFMLCSKLSSNVEIS